MAICRRHAAWSVATLTDGLVTNLIVPMGPLLLLSHLELVNPYLNTAEEDVDPLQAQAHKDGMGNEASMHWAVVARLWSQVCGGSRAMTPRRLPFVIRAEIILLQPLPRKEMVVW